MKKICDIKGFHDYTDWRVFRKSRTDGTIAGMSYVMARSDCYIRNCKCCGKLDTASNEVEKGIKSRTSRKPKTLELVRNEVSK